MPSVSPSVCKTEAWCTLLAMAWHLAERVMQLLLASQNCLSARRILQEMVQSLIFLNPPSENSYLGLTLPATSLKDDVGVLRSQELLVGDKLSHQLGEGQCVRHVSRLLVVN